MTSSNARFFRHGASDYSWGWSSWPHLSVVPRALIVALRVNGLPLHSPMKISPRILMRSDQLFDAEWPRVESTEGARSSEDLFISLYNAQTHLEYEWVSLAGRIRVDGIDFVRDEVENWRDKTVC